MRRFGCLSFVICLALGNAGPVRADAQADAKAILEKAIKAQGDEAKVAKIKASTTKLKGKWYGMGEGIDYVGEWSMQQPDKMREEIEAEVMGMKFKLIKVVNGDKGWFHIMGKTEDMDKETLAEAKEEMYVESVTTLLPLRDKMFQLAPLGDFKVGDRAVVGLKVSSKGHRDINLFFDKDKGLLLKSDTVVKDPMMGGDKEMAQETFYMDYKAIDGVQHAMKIKVNREGKLFVDGEVVEFKTHEKLDDKVFAKP